MNGVMNAGYPGYNQQQPQIVAPSQQQQTYAGAMSAQYQAMPAQPQTMSAQYQAMPAQPLAMPAQVTNASRPLMASSPVLAPDDADTSDNTKMMMRQQRDVANAAGMKCSQFWSDLYLCVLKWFVLTVEM